MLISEFEKNDKGTDYFIGDIHGECGKVMEALNRVSFNFNTDRLFSVGDLIDRGPDNLKCLWLLKEPWFFSIKGNHEQLMLDALKRGSDRVDEQMWHVNGGDWYYKQPHEMILATEKMIPVVSGLPNAIKVGNIGVVHAECPTNDWDMLEGQVEGYMREKAMWSRKRITNKETWLVRGVDAVVVGHTPVVETTILGNHVYIDSGAVFVEGRPLTMLSYDEILTLVGKD